MKKIVIALSAITIIMWSCSNEKGKDSVDKADSANKTNAETPGMKTVSTDEESSSFMVKAANGGMTEVQLGEMGQQKALNPRVKDFAAMMVHDHSMANDQVKSLAAQRNVTLPTMVSDDSQKEIADMAKKDGKEFDKAFMDHMVKAHESTIDLFEKAGDKVNDTEVKTFISNTLPKLHIHLDSAKAVRKLLK